MSCQEWRIGMTRGRENPVRSPKFAYSPVGGEKVQCLPVKSKIGTTARSGLAVGFCSIVTRWAALCCTNSVRLVVCLGSFLGTRTGPGNTNDNDLSVSKICLARHTDIWYNVCMVRVGLTDTERMKRC